jgi:acetyl-CoA acetyltransferase
MRVQRYMHEHGVRQGALRAIALASYHHAQSNPRAVMHGKPLNEAKYEASRWIVEPFHLYDCCMENDGAAALVLVSEERARDFRQKPVYLLGTATGSGHRRAASAEWLVAKRAVTVKRHHPAAASAEQVRWVAEVKRRPGEPRHEAFL